MALTDISNRLTPSVPIELTFASQVIATGKKFTTLFGHMTQAGGEGMPYQVYQVINVGNAVAAQAEVDALAGSGSQIGLMAAAFVNAVVNSNFPAFRVVLLPAGELHFGPNDEAIDAVGFLRSDMFVSCYPASDSVNEATLQALAVRISGIDRDLSGQFGSFVTVGSLDPKGTSYGFNSRNVIVAHLPDSNNQSLDITGSLNLLSNVITGVVASTLSATGTVASGSKTITAVSSVEGLSNGASISGTGIPANTTVASFTASTITMSAAATASASAEALTIVNKPATAGVYPGAVLSGAGIPAGTVVESVTASTITMSANATAAASNESIIVENMVSQPAEIVAAAHASGMMSSQFPYNPLQGVAIGGLVPPQKTSDWVALDPNGDSEIELVNGNSPLRILPGKVVGFTRTRTTYNLLPDGVTAATSYFDWQDLAVMNDFREDVYQITQNPPFNNNPGGTKASLTVAGFLKDEILRQAQYYEDNSAFQAVKTLAPQFLVAPSATSRGRFDFKIPVNVLPGLYVIAGNIQAVTTFDFTL